MADYWVNRNAQANGDHEVHKQGCSDMPSDKKYLGDFSSCYWCSRECHTG